MTFEDYVAQRRDALFGFAVVLSGDPVLADDLVQNVLGRAFERWAQVGSATHVHAYVRRMIVNEYLSWRRRLRYSVPSDAIADLLAESPDHAVRHAERLAMIAELDRLPRRQRAAVVLRYYADLDDDEIASTLGCRASTVRSHIARALATLRIELTPADASATTIPKDL